MSSELHWVPSPWNVPVAARDTDGCVPTGRLCWDLAGYFLWPFGKVIQKVEVGVPWQCPGVGSWGALCTP